VKTRNPIIIHALILPALLLLGLLLADPAAAAWSEAGVTILRLDEAASRLGVGQTPRGGVAMDWPVILPANWQTLGPKALEVAVIQSGLSVRRDAGGLTIVDPHVLGERERAERRRIPFFAFTPRGSDASSVNAGGVALYGKLLSPPLPVGGRRRRGADQRRHRLSLARSERRASPRERSRA
jgi:hypothetical protein